jgi:signal transduction histidine kinase
LVAIESSRHPIRARWFGRRVFDGLTLAQRLLLTSTLTVGIGMAFLGYWAAQVVQDGILRGVSVTASIDALIGAQLAGIGSDQPLSPSEMARLKDVFTIGNEAASTRLLQIRLYDADGEVVFDSQDGLSDSEDTSSYIVAGLSGELVANIRTVSVEPVGPLAVHPISVLKVYAPIRGGASGEPRAVAELYFGAAVLLELSAEAQRNVWIIVGGIGAAVTVLLLLLVNGTSQTLIAQRDRLARNLLRSRKLARENKALHRQSEKLRLEANAANENLLAQVGSDIHDGPIQLLTLLILRLTGVQGKANMSAEPEAESMVGLARDAMQDLRNISNGLVLPELAELNLEEVIRTAVKRHEDLTGSIVNSKVGPANFDVPVAVKGCAYRVTQEALTNAFRHGGGRQQTVTSSVAGDHLILEILNPLDKADRGGQSEEQRSLGLRGMRFRVESIGGDLTTEIGPEDRARVVARIPLSLAE